MKLSEILNKLQGLNWKYDLKSSEIVTDKNVRLSVSAQVDGYFAGQITVACVHNNRVIYRYAAVDLSENEMIAEWYLKLKNNSVNNTMSENDKFAQDFKTELGLS
jgi:hypothetical protein